MTTSKPTPAALRAAHKIVRPHCTPDGVWHVAIDDEHEDGPHLWRTGEGRDGRTAAQHYVDQLRAAIAAAMSRELGTAEVEAEQKHQLYYWPEDTDYPVPLASTIEHQAVTLAKVARGGVAPKPIESAADWTRFPRPLGVEEPDDA